MQNASPMRFRRRSPVVYDPANAPSALDRGITRCARRLLPFLLLMYVVAFLDRANIAFARPALQATLGISPHSYALGAGLFFLTYAALEIPSNLLLHRVGAKAWMARIMVTWGVVSAATLFVKGNTSFYVLRLLLGAAEAGFFPGVILYLSYWFPMQHRARVLGIFYLGAPLAFIFGTPLSNMLLHMHPLGSLRNWQWMFLVEGSLAVSVGLWSYWYLDSRPSNALWLPPEERDALISALAKEEQQRRAHRPGDVLSLFRDRRVVQFTFIYLLIQISLYGVVFYLPAEVAAILHGATGLRANILAALPWWCAFFAAFALPRLGDRIGSYRTLAAVTLLISGLASLALPLAHDNAGFAALCVAAAGYIAVQPLFWTMPADYLPDRAAAAGFALINAVGNVGGFFAPNLKVWAEEHFHSPHAGIYLLASLTLTGAAMIALVRSTPPARLVGATHG